VFKNNSLAKSSPKFFSSKINLKHVADSDFDVKNEFHANRMKFGVLGTKTFLRQFYIYQSLESTKEILYFGSGLGHKKPRPKTPKTQSINFFGC
jgi:hypothetical protein